MVAYLADRLAALEEAGWKGRDAEWLGLVCLHSGVFLRSQYLAYLQTEDKSAAVRFVTRLGTAAVEEPWPGSRRLRTCRIVGRGLYASLGVENVRHRRRSEFAVMLRRLLSLDYVLEHPEEGWLATEEEKVGRLVAAGVERRVLPYRDYGGSVPEGAMRRYFAHKLPIAVTGDRATFVYVQGDAAPQAALRTWGVQHAALWAALQEGGIMARVVVVGRDPVQLAVSDGVLKEWRESPGARAGELVRLRRVVADLDEEGMAPFGGLNGAIGALAELEKLSQLSAGAKAPAIADGETWWSRRVPL